MSHLREETEQGRTQTGMGFGWRLQTEAHIQTAEMHQTMSRLMMMTSSPAEFLLK